MDMVPQSAGVGMTYPTYRLTSPIGNHGLPVLLPLHQSVQRELFSEALAVDGIEMLRGKAKACDVDRVEMDQDLILKPEWKTQNSLY
jgi:hypothetical protein